MPHHYECWLDNDGCATYGCTGEPIAQFEESAPYIEEQRGFVRLPQPATDRPSHPGRERRVKPFPFGLVYCAGAGLLLLMPGFFTTTLFSIFLLAMVIVFIKSPRLGAILLILLSIPMAHYFFSNSFGRMITFYLFIFGFMPMAIGIYEFSRPTREFYNHTA